MSENVKERLAERLGRLKKVFLASFLSIVIYTVIYFIFRNRAGALGFIVSLAGMVPLIFLIISLVVIKINSKCPYCDKFVYFGYLFYAKHCPKCREIINENGA